MLKDSLLPITMTGSTVFFALFLKFRILRSGACFIEKTKNNPKAMQTISGCHWQAQTASGGVRAMEPSPRAQQEGEKGDEGDEGGEGEEGE